MKNRNQKACSIGIAVVLFFVMTVVPALARIPRLQPVGVESKARTVSNPGPGTYYLEMDATVPPELGTRAIHYGVWIDDRQVVQQMGRGDWNVNYIPYWTVDREENGKGTFRYVRPLQVEADSDIRVFVPEEGGSAFDDLPRPAVPPEWEGTVSNVRLRPAIDGLSASLKTSKDHQIHFTSEDPTARITVRGPSGASYSGTLVIQHMRLADSLGGANWHADTRVTEVKRLRETPVNVDLSGGSDQISVPVPGDANRSVGFTLILKDGNKRWHKYLGAVAMVPPREMDSYRPGGRFLSSYHLSIRKGDFYIRGTDLDGDVGLNGLKRMGIDWVRHANFIGTWMPDEDTVDWNEADKMYDAFRENRIHVLHAVGPVPKWMRGPGWDQGLNVDGDLKDVNFKGRTIKTDYTPRREMLPLFGEAHRKFYERYKDVVRGANIWNEPWEGSGITGWKSTGEHYHRIYEEIVDAVQEVDPSINIVAADSPHNTNWKLFAAGPEWAEPLDAISTHYTSPSTGYSFSLASAYDKEVWETETWLAWKGGAASVRHALYYFAVGGDRVSLYNDQMFFDKQANPTPTAVWTGATREMLENLDFKKIVHPKRPPFVMLFEGENRNVAAVLSGLKGAKTSEEGSFRSQFVDDEAIMHLEGGDEYNVYDMLANPIEKQTEGSELVVPVTAEPRYIEFEGSVAKFQERLENARYEEMRPAEIFVHDMTAPVGEGAVIPVEVKNAYGREITGTLTLEADGLELKQSEKELQLAGAKKKKFTFSVTGTTKEENRFPVRVHLETNRGSASVEDTIFQSVIARGTPEIDGDVSEWEQLGAKPVLLNKAGASGEQSAWFPWRDFAESEGGFNAQLAYMADGDNLYMMARVKDDSKNILPSLLAGNDLHTYQKEPYDYTYVSAGPLPGQNGDHIQLSLAGPDNKPYQPKYEVYPPDHPLHRFGAHLNSDYLYMIYPTDDGDAEIMRMRTPDFYYLHPFPVDYQWMSEHCRVRGANVAVKRQDDGYIYECSIPWSELEELPHRPGDQIRVNAAVQNKGKGNRLTRSAGRTAARKCGLDFEPGYGQMWNNSIWWGFMN